MENIIPMAIYLVAIIILIIINIVFINKKYKVLDNAKPFRTELVNIKIETIDKAKAILQSIECEKCANENKTMRCSIFGFDKTYDKCKYATMGMCDICLAKDKQYFIDKLNIEQKNERIRVLGIET